MYANGDRRRWIIRWTWRLIHMKSLWNHISITSHQICLNYIKKFANFIRVSNEVNMNFLRISYEMKSNLFIWNSREVHMNFVWSSNELLMNFIWNEIKFIHMNLLAVRMKFIWTSYRRTNEVNMLYPSNNNAVDMRLINSSHEIHMKFIWISNDLNFLWTSCEFVRITWQVHKKFLCTTHEYGFWHTCYVLHMNEPLGPS